jgi:hypothetical protein
MIDVEALRTSTDLVDLVGRYVDLRRSGSEWQGCCPFHDERTPSFTVSPQKGFVHCFGCGAHHDAIGFVMAAERVDFAEACRRLGAQELPVTRRIEKTPSASGITPTRFVPLMPAPDDAPELYANAPCRVLNPKRGRHWTMTPTRADAYRDAQGRLLGYVLRIDMSDGAKITPQVTWCVGPDGREEWTLWPFTRPRPLCGLDALADRPDAPVLAVEGEKCRAAGAGALPHYAVITWAGGGKGVRYADWTPLTGRDVVLWPDADAAGRDAMLGRLDYAGVLHRGVAQLAHAAGCRSLRLVDPIGQPKGWDIADALFVDGWTPAQLARWARSRVKAIDVEVDLDRCAV